MNGLLSLSEGAHFTGVNQPLVAEKLRLGPQGATSLVVRIVATSPGVKNMTGNFYISNRFYILYDFSDGQRSIIKIIILFLYVK